MRRIAVLAGPRVAPVDPAEAFRGWPADVDVELATVACADAAALTAQLRRAASEADGIVLAPGAAAGSPALAAAVRGLGIPVVAVAPSAPAGPRRSPVAEACAAAIVGRGTLGYRWAIRHLVERAAWPLTTLRYGAGGDHVGDLRLPAGDGPHSVVALLHGGFWRDQWRRDLMDALAVDLARRGYATWNVEYRRVGASGGGWPHTLVDVGAAVDTLADLARDHPLDPGRVVLLGHSAGAQLALWAAGRRAQAPGAGHGGQRPPLVPALVVSLAGVLDLAAAAREGLGGGAAVAFLGPPARHPLRYRQASPAARVPIGVPQLLVHGTADDRVPAGMSRDYAAAAAAGGDQVHLEILDGVDHFQVIEPRSAAWRHTAARLAALAPPGA